MFCPHFNLIYKLDYSHMCAETENNSAKRKHSYLTNPRQSIVKRNSQEHFFEI